MDFNNFSNKLPEIVVFFFVDNLVNNNNKMFFETELTEMRRKTPKTRKMPENICRYDRCIANGIFSQGNSSSGVHVNFGKPEINKEKHVQQFLKKTSHRLLKNVIPSRGSRKAVTRIKRRRLSASSCRYFTCRKSSSRVDRLIEPS